MSYQEKHRIKNKYDKIAAAYDAVIDRLIPGSWRERAAGSAFGNTLEVGVGTGLNLPFYTDSCLSVLGIDVSPRMLDLARKRAVYSKVPVKLEEMDIQSTSLKSGSFDSVLAAFVFCTVPDPVLGLRECHRVLKPGGRLILLEHMASGNTVLKCLMNWLNPITVMFLSDNINRNTNVLVAKADFIIKDEINLLGDVVRLIVAEK